jgi:hypothetical protein
LSKLNSTLLSVCIQAGFHGFDTFFAEKKVYVYFEIKKGKNHIQGNQHILIICMKKLKTLPKGQIV